MFQKRRIRPHIYNTLDRGLVDLRFSSFYAPSPVDEFTFEQVKNPDGEDSVTLTSDISMLFNQQRLDKCSRETLLRYFDNLSVSFSPLKELRSKLSDSELISLVKSRYMQTPSELLTYSTYLVNEFGSSLASLVHSPVVDPPTPQNDVTPE